MKVFVEIAKDSINETFEEELAMVVSEYYTDCQVFIVHEEKLKFELKNKKYNFISVLTKLEKQKFHALYSLKATFYKEDYYIVHYWSGDNYLDKAQSIKCENIEGVSEYIYKLDSVEWGCFSFDDIREMINLLIKNKNYFCLSPSLLKLEKDAKVILNSIDDIFIRSLTHSDGLNRTSDLLEMEIFQKLKSEYFTKKNNNHKNPFIKEYYDAVYEVVDNITTQKVCIESATSKQIFKSYKSLANLALYLAVYKKEKLLTNLSYITLFRVLELYLTGFLLLSGDIEPKRTHGNKIKLFTKNDSKIQGFGSIWYLIKNKSIINNDVLKKIDKYIDLRNDHLYGHGFNLSGPNLNRHFLEIVTGIITSFESKISFKDNSWEYYSDINKKLFKFPFKKNLLSNLFKLNGLHINSDTESGNRAIASELKTNSL